MLPDDVIRMEKFAPGQVGRTGGGGGGGGGGGANGAGLLSARAMRRRREQLAVRLSACPEGALERFVDTSAESWRNWLDFCGVDR
jgi:hypothetical protein